MVRGEGDREMRRQTRNQERATAGTAYRVDPHDSRSYALYDTRTHELVGVFVYLKGAAYVARRLADLEAALSAAVEHAAAGCARVSA